MYVCRYVEDFGHHDIPIYVQVSSVGAAVASGAPDCTAAASTTIGDYGDLCSQDYIIIAEGSESNAFGAINYSRQVKKQKLVN